MKNLMGLFAAAVLSTSVHAAPPAKADPAIGKTLHNKSCVSCHASMFGGDGSQIYSRDNRKIKTAKQLAARVSACNANSGAGWFPEDEAHVAAYLNQQYYQFK
jgi:mono/diheme cytochrome c family protein